MQDDQSNKLKRFVTSMTSNVFALKNLPEVIKGALFSKYSRSCLSLRELLLKEFILNEEMAFENIAENVSSESENQTLAIQKAQNFYDRILDGYGDDSIGELGGAHLALENISMLAAKEVEDCRIGGSPLEKSTRYVYFDQKVDGDYLFYKEPALMTSAYRLEYLAACRRLFDVYAELVPPLTIQMEGAFPRGDDVSKVAYTAALRAKVLDCLRGLLPASTLTNMGVFGNGRFYETLVQKLNAHPLLEMHDLGNKAHEELSKVIPSFVRRAEPSHRHQKAFSEFRETSQSRLKGLTLEHSEKIAMSGEVGVKLIDFDKEAHFRLAAGLLYHHSTCSLGSLSEYVKTLGGNEIRQIFDSVTEPRTNRRHKSPRALEQVSFTFEIVSDFGAYRDLQRHRMLTQERQLLSCDYGYYIPEEILGTKMEPTYRQAMEKAKETYDRIAVDLPEEAQYVVPMAYNVRWYFHINLRALQWLCELRSQPQGHPTYRLIAQEMAALVIKQYPEFAGFFKFVDFEGYDLGRMDQELRSDKKLTERQIEV